MYLLVGNMHMESTNYEGAIQSFERARPPIRPHTNRTLLAVSLVSFLTVQLQCIETILPPCQISGWKFDDLDITVRQRLCEALYAAGRTREAGESLLKMVNTFDEGVYMGGPITKWVSGEFMYR